jgi:hypothetical protein
VTLTATASDGKQSSQQQDVVIETSDLSGLLTSTVLKLIGGSTPGSSKVWVFDQWNNYTTEVAEALSKSIKGHLGLGPLDSYSSDWYGAGPDEKTGAGWRIYEETFTFSLGATALKLDVDNPGDKGYGRLANDISKNKFPSATPWLDPNNGNAPSDAEAEFTYTGGSYTFSVTEAATAGYPKLTLPSSSDAFLGYYVGTQEYDIIYLTDSVLAVRARDSYEGDGFDWVFIFIRQDLNIQPEPEPEKTLGEVSYPVESFEGTPAFTITVDNATGSEIIDNPFKGEGNNSDKVYKYVKPEGEANWWANLFYLDAAHKFDLSAKNKIKVKVYIPSTNDYTTPSDGVAHEGIPANSPLLKQLVLKLQDNSKGGNAWESQVEKKHADLAVDQWIELTFDFSDVSTRQDFDKIVIQFGQEGHKRSGTFYFDDLQFFTE